MSFLGTLINREDNYKKLAKINSTRINQLIGNEEPYASKKTNLLLTPTVLKVNERRRVMSQSNNPNQLLPTSDINKKHTLAGSRRVIPPTGK